MEHPRINEIPKYTNLWFMVLLFTSLFSEAATGGVLQEKMS